MQTSASCHSNDGTLGKPLMNRGALSWFHIVSTYGEEVIEYRTLCYLKIHLNYIYIGESRHNRDILENLQ
jgi:hypothetical protein